MNLWWLPLVSRHRVACYYRGQHSIPIVMSAFAKKIITWQKRDGRHDLPWQKTRDPYRIWLSEIMLQQTLVSAVVPYYARFLERFPDIATLASASIDDVMPLWAGEGKRGAASFTPIIIQSALPAVSAWPASNKNL